MDVSVGRDFDIHFVETAFLINATQIRSRKTGGSADGVVDVRQRNLAVLIEHNPAIGADHHHLRNGSRPIGGWITRTQGFTALQRICLLYTSPSPRD